MALNLDVLTNLKIPPIEQTLEARDIILYALGIGLGSDPLDARQLQFVYEKNLRMLPTMAIVLGYAGPLSQYGDTGITGTHVVHGEQGFVIHRALPVTGKVVGTTRITGVIDKGEGRGALIFTETAIREAGIEAPLATLTNTTFCRADGGFGGPTGPVPPVHALPKTAPERVCDLATLPQAALIYRLSGDYNPLHADPAYAKRGGYDQPILHGRCTFGVVGHALLKTCCDYDPTRLVAMEGRFSSPVFPGETIRTEIWQAGEEVSFRATVPARDIVVLNNGRARIRAAHHAD
jgi:acyl dehydratase